jgi:hypothetical protein
MRKLFLTLLAVLTIFSFCCVTTIAQEVGPLTEEQLEEFDLDGDFFKKGTNAQGVLIATSAGVSDLTHIETAYQFNEIMTRIRPDIAERIRKRQVLCILIGHDEQIAEIPQFGTDKTGEELDFYNWRNRGFLSSRNGRPVVVFAEEDVMEFEGGMTIESILIHEFAHVIHGVGFDEELQTRLTETFAASKEAGLWNDGYAAQRFRRVKSETPVSLLDALVESFPDVSRELLIKCLDGGDIIVNGEPVDSSAEVTKDDKVRIVFGGEKECYAGKNRAEFWAEGVQNWYDTNRTMDHDHNHIHTREQLIEYDPELAAMCEDILTDDPWRFVSPRDRAGEGHLADYDPETAPTVSDPPHIKNAANDYYDEYWHDFWDRLREKYVE